MPQKDVTYKSFTPYYYKNKTIQIDSNINSILKDPLYFLGCAFLLTFNN